MILGLVHGTCLHTRLANIYIQIKKYVVLLSPGTNYRRSVCTDILSGIYLFAKEIYQCRWPMFTRCIKQVLNKLNIQIHWDKELQVHVFVLSWNSFFFQGKTRESIIIKTKHKKMLYANFKHHCDFTICPSKYNTLQVCTTKITLAFLKTSQSMDLYNTLFLILG